MPNDVNDDHKSPLHHVRVGLPGGAVHDIELAADAQVSVLTSKVYELENLDPSSARIRLIVAGKLIPDHSQLIREVVPDGGFIHCAISDIEPPSSNNNSSLTDQTNSITPTADRELRIPIETYNIDGEVRIVIPNLSSQVAYDRLLQAGFTADEIRMIRRHIRTLRREARGREDSILTTASPLITASPPTPSDEQQQPQQQPQQQQQQHQQQQTTRTETTTVRSNQFPTRRHHVPNLTASGGEGTNSDFLMGCIFGYLLGVIILVLLLDNNATRRWRVGIIAGVATNCAFGVLRQNVDIRAAFRAP